MTTLVLLPGLDGTGRLFSRFEAALEGRDFVRMSYPPDEPLGYDALVDRVAPTLPRTPFVLVAESFSGPLALALARRAPPALRGVVLVATFVECPIPRVPRSLAARLAPILTRLPPPRSLVRRLLTGTDSDGKLVDEFVEASRHVDPGVLAMRMLEVIDVDARAALTECPVPVTYLGGARDALLPRHLPTTLQRLRPSLTVTRLDAPHLVLQRAPREACDAIDAFLATLVSMR